MSLTPGKFIVTDGSAANQKQPMQSSAWGPTELDALDAAAVKKDGSGNVELAGTLRVSAGSQAEIDVGEEVLENSSTGVYQWDAPGLAVSLTQPQVDVSAGDGHIVNFHDDPEAPSYTNRPWAAQAVSVALADGVTYLYVDPAGAVQQQTSPLTPTQRRENVYLGFAVTQSGVVLRAFPAPDVVTQPANQLHELYDGLGALNKNARATAGGANLTLAFSGGSLLFRGAGFINNPAAPNEVLLPASNPKTFAYVTQLAGSTQADTTLVDPTQYDNAGAISAITGSANRATNQRLYLFPSGNIRIQYGQVVYNSLTDAVQAAPTEAFVVNPNFPGNGILLETLSVTKGATSLSNPDQARFLPAGKLGEQSIGGAGQSVTTLQQAYNNSTDGTIATDGTRGPFTVDGDMSLPSLPTSDPGVAGRLWIDASAGFALKVSQG